MTPPTHIINEHKRADTKHDTTIKEDCTYYGGAGGIGQAAAKVFAAEGPRVVLVDRDEDALKSVVSSLGDDIASYVVADVTHPKQVEGYVAAAVER